MIIWITGQSGSGKTTMAYQMKRPNTIVLDGDELRAIYPTGFSATDRRAHNIRVAQLALLLEQQGFNVIVATICPYKSLRDEVQKITNCSFIYLGSETRSKDYPYEYEVEKRYWSIHRPLPTIPRRPYKMHRKNS